MTSLETLIVDDYALLGVSSSTTNEEIRKVYHTILKDNHPNKKGFFDEAKVRDITTAYGRIMSTELRKKYETRSDPFVVFADDNLCPTIDTAYTDIERRMREMRINDTATSPYYSKASYLVRRNGRTYKKIQENINGNLREFEEYV